MKNLTLFSPAKVNLFFRVIGKRNDGYHEIATLMQAISFGDQLQVALSEKDLFQTNHPRLDSGSDNTVMKALSLFRKTTGECAPFEIFLEKQIPIGAGLGGGSSNAASALWAFNELTGRPLVPQKLMECAAQIGADVSFFLSNGEAYCTGFGDVITPVENEAIPSFTLAIPQIDCSTPLVYRHCTPTPLSGDESKYPLFVNDLEHPAFKLYPPLEQIKKKLVAHGFDHVVMTGSGSAFVCVGDVIPLELDGIQMIPVKKSIRLENEWFNG